MPLLLGLLLSLFLFQQIFALLFHFLLAFDLKLVDDACQSIELLSAKLLVVDLWHLIDLLTEVLVLLRVISLVYRV